MGCGLYAGGKEFGESNTRKNEDGTERCPQAQPLMQNDKCGNPGKNRLKGKDESGVSGGQVLLRPGLDTECRRSSEERRYQDRGKQARGEVHPWMLKEGQAQGHEHGAEGYLQDGKLLKRNPWTTSEKARGRGGQIPGHRRGRGCLRN